MGEKHEKSLTLCLMPWRGGNKTAGRRAIVPEDSMWESQNATSKLDGLIEKRPGLVQWGQTLKVPTISTDSITAFVDFLNGTSGFTVTENDAANKISDPFVKNGVLQTNVATSSGTENYKLSYNIASASTNSTWSLRFLFRGTNLPDSGSASANTFSFLGHAAANTGKQFAIWNDGIYYLASGSYTKVTDSDIAGAGGWVTIEVRCDDDGGNTEVYMNDLLLETLTSSDLDAVAPTGTAAFEFRWQVEGTETTQYSTQIASPMYNDTDDTPFSAVEINTLTDFQFTTPAGSVRRALLVAAGNYIYHDLGLFGIWRPLHPKQYSSVYFTSFQNTMVWFDSNRGKFSNIWQWDGVTNPERLNNTPPLMFGAEHQGRLWGVDPTTNRLYYSGDRQPEVWYAPGINNISDEFDTLVNAGYLSNPSNKKGDKITAFRGDFHGLAIICTRHGAYQLSGSGINSYQLKRVGSSDAGGAENEHCIAPMGNDLVTFSRKGIHLLSATEQFGDIQASFLSRDIQDLWADDPTSVETINGTYRDRARLKYNPQQGLLYAGVPLTGDTHAVKVFVYNQNTQHWRGPWTIDSRAMENVEIATPEREVMMHGGEDGRIGFTDQYHKADFGTDAYTFKIASTLLNGRSIDPKLIGMEKTWKRMRVYIHPRGKWDITVNWQVEGKPTKTQTKSQNVFDAYGLTDDFKIGNDPAGRLRSREEMGFMNFLLDSKGQTLFFELEQDGLGEDARIEGVEIDFTVSGYEEQ